MPGGHMLTLTMIEDVQGKSHTEVGVGDHWAMFREVRQEDRVFPAMADAIANRMR